MDIHVCRACRGSAGELVLDLGDQPACDYFPANDDPGPDPEYPLQMWLCASCGLAQLLADPTVPEEPRGTEPAALVAQAADAVERVASAGLAPAGATVAEYGSPHGGSWLDLLSARGLIPATDQPGEAGAAGQPGEPEPADQAGHAHRADVVLDCFGMMHAADQATAMADRAARVAPGGVLLLQYHALHTIVTRGQWNALRHGHYAYYSTTALTAMLAAVGFSPVTAWRFELYGGTVLLAARRDADTDPGAEGPDEAVRSLLADDAQVGVTDPDVLRGLERDAKVRADSMHDWLVAQRAAGRSVLGYGAASRAVALLRKAQTDRDLLPAVVDSSPAKQGLRMPGTSIPVVTPAELASRGPDSVLLFLPDLMPEVRAAYPEVEAAGGSWVDVEALGDDD